jgi:hypothetical protein
MAEATVNPVPQKVTNKRSSLPIVIIGVALLGAAIGGGIGFWRGAIYGKRQATNQTLKTVANIANPLNLLANNPIFPNTVVGKITDKSSAGMSVKQVNGDVKKLNFDGSTQVTHDNKVLTVNDLKKDNDVTVFTKTGRNGKGLIASRVLIR